MAPETVYLDHNATSPVLPAAAEAIQRAWQVAWGNPASQHSVGRAAKRLLEESRREVISLLGGNPTGPSPDRLVLTSGGTEANSLALRGMLAGSPARRLVVSSIEHPSIAATAGRLAGEGVRVDRLPVGADGCIDPASLQMLLDDRHGPVGLVSVMLASNETGVIQPLEEIGALCARRGVPLHTDAVQGVGKLASPFRNVPGLVALTFTAHKFHGPLGIGGLLLSPEARVAPELVGGRQQEGLRAGTESAALAAGLAAALGAAVSELSERAARMARLRDRLEAGMLDSWPGAVVVAGTSPRLPHATCIALRGGDRQSLVMAYDLAGVACSSGSACASGSTEPSPTLVAMGLEPGVVGSAVRFAVGALTTEHEIDEAIARIGEVNGRLVAGLGAEAREARLSRNRAAEAGETAAGASPWGLEMR